MKLSEAIRLGSMMKPQATGSVLKHGGTCALGAALDAIGHDLEDGWLPVYSHWPIAGVLVKYPGKEWSSESAMVGSCCWILNDADKWTREAIADWVETIEQAQESPVPQESPVAVSVKS